MALPNYFQQGVSSDEFYYSTGDRVYGTLVVRGTEVRYRFNDGSRLYEETRQFSTTEKAERFASRFGTEMRKCAKRNSVLTTSTFRTF